MSKKLLKQLLNKKLDGTLSPQEQSALDDLISKNSDFENIAKTYSVFPSDKHMQSIPALGADFTDSVMYKINNKKYKESARLTMSNERSSIGSKLAMAFIFIFGLLLGGGLIYLSLTSEAQNEQIKYFSLFGTMGDSGTMSDFVEADKYTYENSDLNVNITTKFSNDMILLEYEVFSAEKIKIIMTYEERNLRFFASKKFFEATETSLLTSNNLIQVENIGKNKFLFLFVNQTRRPANINVLVQKGLETISESKLISNK